MKQNSIASTNSIESSLTSRRASALVRNISFFVLLILFWCAMTSSALAQGQQTAARPDRGVNPGGAYSVSDVENINLQNGNVNLSIPLASLPPIAGGKLSFTLRAYYNSKRWNVTRQEVEGGAMPYRTYVVDKPQPAASYQDASFGGWSIVGGYSIAFRDAHDDFDYVTPPSPDPSNTDAVVEYQWLTQHNWYKVILITPDGAEHELRPASGNYLTYGGSGHPRTYLNGYHTANPDTMGVPVRFNSIDGTFLSAIVNPANDASGIHWTIFLPDGTQVIQYSDGSERLRDVNGNSIKIFSDNGVAHYQDEQTGREIKVTAMDQNGQVQVQYQTVTGVWQQITINYGETVIKGKLYKVQDWNPSVVTETGGQGDTCWRHQQLQPKTLSVIREIVFPKTDPNEPDAKARTFSFKYNSDDTETATTEGVISTCGTTGSTYTREASRGLGAISQMVTPSGATVDYSYTLASQHDFIDIDGANKIVRETITQKTLTQTDKGVTDTWTYNIQNDGASPISTVTNPDGATETMLFYPFNPDFSRFYGAGGEERSGLVFRTQESGLTRVEKHWTMQGTAPATGSENVIALNPYMDAEYTSLLDANGNPVKMSAKKYQYDFNGNVTEVKEYDWFDPSLVTRDSNGVPTDVPAGATLLRDTQTSYYNSAPNMSSANYYANRSLTSGVVSLLGAQKEADLGASKTQVSYDGQTFGTAPTKGNVTGVSKYDDVTSSWLTTSMSYDSYGNVISTTDPKGNVTQVFYEDATHAMPTRVVVDPNNGTGQQTSLTSYDFSTGLVTGQTDANGAVATIDYTNQLLGAVDPFGRPGIAYSPAVTVNGPRHKTVTTYEDHLRRVTVASDLNAEGDGLIKSRTTADQLGRPILAEQSEDGTNFTISSETAYEQAGKYVFQSNPHRSASALTDGWTRSTKDLLGRVTEVATFSGSTKPSSTADCNTAINCTGAVTTSYDANYTTVTDQAGKQRRSVTNALGQLVRVDEPDLNNNLGSTSSPTQPTSYGYDVLGNLTQVTQGNQNRTFTYSSLSRLTSATNPESGTIQYQYDVNGNLVLKIDPRLLADNQTHVQTTYEYDGLNRVKSRTYNDGTPNVTYTYDTLANGKGRLTSVTSSVSTTSYGQYDALGRVRQSSQTTDGHTYAFPNYDYNLAGALTSETYPSGRVVTTGYDNAGRLASVTGQMNSTVTPYASSFSYSAGGAVTAMKLGNNLWEHSTFNSRLQPTQIGLGTSGTDSAKLQLDYSYGTTNNNGNVQSQTITVPTVGTATGYTATQTYTYDELNRLKSATEMSGTTQSWKQTFFYDRFGNRTFDTNNTSQGMVSSLLTIDPNTNRFVTPQGNLLYDATGNLKTDFNGHTFSYDAENHQTKYDGGSTAGGTDYKYDGDGRRVEKVNGVSQQATIFVYDAGGKLVAEYDTATQSGNGGTSYLTEDNLGTPRVITDSGGSVKSRHDYAPFGEELSYNVDLNLRSPQQGYVSDTIKQKFTQKERDSESGLDYFQARYYISGQGRFTSPDPLLSSGRLEDPQTWNRYSYALNNPIINTDPTGMWQWSEALGGSRKDKDLEKELESAKKAGDKNKTATLTDILTQRKAFVDALQHAKDTASKIKDDNDRKEVLDGLKAYGKPNDGNNVTVGVLDSSDPGAAATIVEGSSIIVAISAAELSSGTLFITEAHEGNHILRATDYLKCGGGAGCSVSLYDSEQRAYTISSIMAQADGGTDFEAVTSKGTTVLWNSSWASSDKKVLENRKAAVQQHLSNLGINANSGPALPGKAKWH